MAQMRFNKRSARQMNEMFLSTVVSNDIEIRGCLSKPKKSQYYSAILQWVDFCGIPQRISRTTKKSKETEAFLIMAKMIEELKEDIKTASPGTSFCDFLQFWLDNVIINEVEETTYVGYQMNVNNHIIPYFRALKLRVKDVRPVHIVNFMNYKMAHGAKNGGRLKAESVARFYSNLKTAFDYALMNNLVTSNPARLAPAPKAPKNIEGEKFVAQYLSIEEISRLWTAAKSDIIFPAILLASIYGFRRGEVCGLKWASVKYESKRIVISETRTRSNRELTKGTKNRSSERSMPLMEAVATYLNLLKMQQDEHRAFCGDVWTDSGCLR